MPKFPRKGGGCPAEDPFPEQKACNHRQIIADPQITPADSEGGIKPAQHKLRGNQSLRQAGKAPVQGPKDIRAGAEEHTGQEASQRPGENKLRCHRHSPRFCFGSS